MTNATVSLKGLRNLSPKEAASLDDAVLAALKLPLLHGEPRIDRGDSTQKVPLSLRRAQQLSHLFSDRGYIHTYAIMKGKMPIGCAVLDDGYDPLENEYDPRVLVAAIHPQYDSYRHDVEDALLDMKKELGSDW